MSKTARPEEYGSTEVLLHSRMNLANYRRSLVKDQKTAIEVIDAIEQDPWPQRSIAEITMAQACDSRRVLGRLNRLRRNFEELSLKTHKANMRSLENRKRLLPDCVEVQGQVRFNTIITF